MAPKRRVGGRTHSSSSSGIFFSADDLSEVQGNSTLTSSCGISSNGNGQGSLGMVYGSDGNGTVLNVAGYSGPSVGASSLVTDANSGLSGGGGGGGPHLQRSVSINTDSYSRLPASPMSFSSNIRSVSGSPIMDGSSVAQQIQEPNSQQSHHQGPSSLSNNRFPGSYNAQLQKKPRLDIKQEDVGVRHQFVPPFSYKQDSLNLQNTHPQLQAMLQQRKFHLQQDILQSMPPVQRAQLEHQLHLRHQFQQQGLQQPSSVMIRQQSYDNGVCSRRIMQYLYHQHQRPLENSLAHWRKFVAFYYSPLAKQRWCFSLHNNVHHHSPGVFPQVTLDSSHCHICGSKPGKGFVTTYEALPRLHEIKFKSGLIDELLFLDLPRETRSQSGEMVLEYKKAVMESVYEKVRVVHDGQLRIIFSPDLKILSWEFCAFRHEEFFPRRIVAPQVNQLLEVVQRCQRTISGKDVVSHQSLQANSNMAVTAAYQLNRSLDLQSLNELGFNKRYARGLQISEVANGMKDLMDFCCDKKLGPIDGLKAFPRHGNASTSQPQNMQKMYNMMPGGSGIQANGNEVRVNGSGQSPHTLTNYNNLLAARRISMNSNHSSLTQEAAPASVNSCNPNYQSPEQPSSQQNSNNNNNPQSPYSNNQNSQETAITGKSNPTSQEAVAINGDEAGLENDTLAVNTINTAANNGLITESNHVLNQTMPGNTVSDNDNELREEDFLDCNIDDFINFEWDDA